MLPVHGGGIPPQRDISPYNIYTTYDNRSITVTVTSKLGVPFEGLMLQARSPDNTLVGYFEAKNEFIHTIDCQNSGDTLTHSNTEKKSILNVNWNPKGYQGMVVFK